jgi:hypothetical protein
MSILHPATLGSADLHKVTAATALNVYFPKGGEGATGQTNAALVTFASIVFEPLQHPC